MPAGADEPTIETGPDTFSCEAEWDARCEHVVDAEMVPYFRRAGIEPELAAPEEFCRRVAIDLLGRIPTLDELSSCTEMQTEEAVDAFMATPDYLREQQRFWAAELEYDADTFNYYRQVLDLFDLLDQMLRGEIRYEEFAHAAVVHPGFYGIHFEDQWPDGVWRIFLGRAPRPDEAANFNAIRHIFVSRGIVDGRIQTAQYQRCTEEGVDSEEDCQQRARDSAGFEEILVNFCECQGLRCSVHALGPEFRLPSYCESEVWENNHWRLIEVTAGDRNTCLGGTPGCLDRMIDWTSDELVDIPDVPMISEELRDGLDAIGDAVISRGDFWDAAVDRELLRFLGWWQQAVRQPDYDVPEVRRALADELMRTGDLREVQRAILTSTLYRASVDAPDGMQDDPSLPPWASGPLKLLSGEAYVRSVTDIADEYFGGCDVRMRSPDRGSIQWQRERLGPTEYFDVIAPHSLPEEYFSSYDDYYLWFSSMLGGCSVGHRPRLPNLSIVSSYESISTQVCSIGPGIVPAGFNSADISNSNLEAAARHLAGLVFSQSPSSDEVAQLRNDMRTCIDGATACTDANVAARWLCQRLVSSSRFILY